MSLQDDEFRDEDARAAAHDAELRDEQVNRADPGPVDDQEAQAAAQGLEASREQAAAYQDMLERGAAQRGEGAPEV